MRRWRRAGERWRRKRREREGRRRELLACALRDALAAADERTLGRLLGPRVRITIDAGEAAVRCDGAGALRSMEGERWEVRSVNGAPGLVARSSDIPLAVVALDIRRGRVREVWVVADPAKLGGW